MQSTGFILHWSIKWRNSLFDIGSEESKQDIEPIVVAKRIEYFAMGETADLRTNLQNISDVWKTGVSSKVFDQFF